MQVTTTTIQVFWSDEELNIHWFSDPGAAAAFGLALRVAASLADVESVSYRMTMPQARTIEGPPDLAAASIHALWRRETAFEGVLHAGTDEYALSALTESGGGQLSLGSRSSVFGARFDDVTAVMKPYADERHIRIVAPLQQTSFGSEQLF
jgi:hypothetical protein